LKFLSVPPWWKFFFLEDEKSSINPVLPTARWQRDAFVVGGVQPESWFGLNGSDPGSHRRGLGTREEQFVIFAII
jgi:hypothetical protein